MQAIAGILSRHKQLVRYLLSGGSAFFTEFLMFLLLYNVLGWPLYVANSLSFCSGLVISFTLNRRWTFGGGPQYNRSGRAQFGLYVLLAGINLVFTNIAIGMLAVAGLRAFAAKLLVMAIIVAWNFLIFKFLIFKFRVV